MPQIVSSSADLTLPTIPAPKLPSLQEAFAEGEYPAWIQEEAKKEKTSPHLVQEIAAQLDAMKGLDEKQRTEEANWILRYYSRSNKEFEPTSLMLHEKIGCTEDDLAKGTYDSQDVAFRLVVALKDYDRAVILPILRQISHFLQANFYNTNVLFLGRDFCSTYLYLYEEGLLPRENLFLANVSRYVRDAANGGKLEELRLVLERIGLDRETLLEKGLLIADSCMQGKIPAVILRALSTPMSEQDRFRFLSRAHIRYLKSSRHEGQSISEKVYSLAAAHEYEMLNDEDLMTLLTKRIEMIKEFPVDYPQEVEEYIPRRHKLFEWRPKTALISMGIDVDEELGPRLVMAEPQTPSEHVLSLLGLIGDLQFAELAQKAIHERVTTTDVASPEAHGNFEPKKMALEVALQKKPAHNRRDGRLLVSREGYKKPEELAPHWFLKEIDRALERGGMEALKAWQNKVDPRVGSVAVMRGKDANFPYELVINGRVIYKFKDIVGEGNNVKVYTTGQNTIVKVIKDAKHVRKNLLLAWAQPVVESVGIKAAKVLKVSPTGLFLEQEILPGPSLETLYGEAENTKIPAKICDQAIQDFRAAKKLISEKGIWLDLKSANYHLDEEEKIVNVDYAPRLNPTYYRYFQTDPEGEKGERRDFKDEEFLEQFFHHDVKKRCQEAAEEAEKKKEKKRDE